MTVLRDLRTTGRGTTGGDRISTLAPAFALVFLGAAVWPAWARASEKRPPNILWICTDQQRHDTIHALGNPHIRTPNLDRLCVEGTAFSRAYCQSPICTPSRASFLTGMYPSTVHGCMNGNERWSGAAPLVTRLLADAGPERGA